METTLAQFEETRSTDPFSLQNPRMLKVRLDAVTVQAKLGSMVAYQGQVSFEHAGSGGMSRMLKKVVTGEESSFMKVDGTGEVFLADRAQEVHVLRLENDRLTVNGPNILAFDAGIDWDIQRVQGGGAGMMAGGLFNVTLSGSGQVALLTDGEPMLLRVAEAPTFADAQAAVAWSGGVTTSLKTDFKKKDLIGRGSGESIQMAFGGDGWVLVQPSEGAVRDKGAASAGGGGAANVLGGLLGG